MLGLLIKRGHDSRRIPHDKIINSQNGKWILTKKDRGGCYVRHCEEHWWLSLKRARTQVQIKEIKETHEPTIVIFKSQSRGNGKRYFFYANRFNYVRYMKGAALLICTKGDFLIIDFVCECKQFEICSSSKNVIIITRLPVLLGNRDGWWWDVYFIDLTFVFEF